VTGTRSDNSRSGPHRLWHAWKRIARKIGGFQARALLTVVYFTVVAPFGLVVRWATDPLALKPRTPRGWRARATADAHDAMAAARRQF